MFDATVTLLRRLIKRERWYAPHRSHAYQRAIQSGLSHRQVAVTALIVNVLLGVLTVIGVRCPAAGWWVALGGLVLLVVLYVLTERRRPMYP